MSREFRGSRGANVPDGWLTYRVRDFTTILNPAGSKIGEVEGYAVGVLRNQLVLLDGGRLLLKSIESDGAGRVLTDDPTIVKESVNGVVLSPDGDSIAVLGWSEGVLKERHTWLDVMNRQSGKRQRIALSSRDYSMICNVE